MFILFFLFWLILNGRITAEIVVFGVVISAAVYAFICKFMDYRPADDLRLIKRLPLFIFYFLVLVKEIILANIAMAQYIFRPQILAEPAIVRFHPDLKSRWARVLLADSITLTPGTITVRMEDGEFWVHCYDKSMGEGLDESCFVRLLRKLEG